MQRGTKLSAGGRSGWHSPWSGHLAVHAPKWKDIASDSTACPAEEMPCTDFTLPILTGVKTHFLTAIAAARHIVPKQSGGILTLSSSASVRSDRNHRYHRTGGFATACTAIEALSRSPAGERSPQGIRVVCLSTPYSRLSRARRSCW